MGVDQSYALDDRYRLDATRVYLTGTQALVRLPLMQRARDEEAGLRTAGYISGYPGSPLGGYDQALTRARSELAAAGVHFQPGLNEDLAATSVLGSQQAAIIQGATTDGVFAIWYGKGPGVDRSVDALKHGAYAGAAANGGVLVVAGDDHGARSSTVAHQSDQAFVHCAIPYLYPSNVQEYLDFGIYGWAMSRLSGCWVGFKAVTDTVESGASVAVEHGRVQVVVPELEAPAASLNIRFAVPPLVAEELTYEHRLPAAQAFVRVNGLDKAVIDGGRRRIGIVTSGKAYLDVRAALDALGIDAARAAELGLCVYKVAMPWPLEPTGILEFVRGLDEVLVVEEKRPVIEEQLGRLLANHRDGPRLVGKTDEHGRRLVANRGELAPDAVAAVLGDRLLALVEAPDVEERLRRRRSGPITLSATEPASTLMRLPTFCSGCPHNTSTRVPEGSMAMSGIGCHGMAVWMTDRPTLVGPQMGGEGAAWIGMSSFTEMPHLFQNLGDGTYSHSGLLAIRAAVAAGVNITYKILLNGAIAMTGGQDIQGEMSAPEVARQVAAEGVARVVVVSDDTTRWRRRDLPTGVALVDRSELDRVQKELREVKGTTVIVYDQPCAAEKRRKRKRGRIPEPDVRVVINERVCEGCGDCSVQSNCISVEPVETAFGRKRRINQSSCNADYSCLLGYCPSFVTVRGGRLRAAATRTGIPAPADLPEPARTPSTEPYGILVAGIGGSGVVTLGALIGMAAHLEGKGVSVLDVAGLAQKNGPVTSHIRVFDDRDAVHAVRIADRGADLVLGADIVVATGAECLGKLDPAKSALVVNDHVAPTGDFARNPDLDLSSGRMRRALERGGRVATFVPATELATALLGDAIYTNLFLLGFACQQGLLPVGVDALDRAIELNGASVEENRRAFAWGRMAAHDPEAARRAAGALVMGPGEGLDDEPSPELVERLASELAAYQDAAYAARYRALVDAAVAAEGPVGGDGQLTRAVARYYFKVLAYKDEYEVARLMLDPALRRSIENQFEGDLRIQYHFAPQILNRRDKDTGRAKKRTFGPAVVPLLRVLAAGKRLRGTPWDVFGRTEHRRSERALIAEYEATVAELLAGLSSDTLALAVEIAEYPEHIRGYDLVKERNVAEVRGRTAELMAKFRDVGSVASA